MSDSENPYAAPREATDENGAEVDIDLGLADAAREMIRVLPWLSIVLAATALFTALLMGTAVFGIALVARDAAIGVTILFLCVLPALLVITMWNARRAIVQLRQKPSATSLALTLSRSSTVLAMLTFLLGLVLLFQAIAMIGALIVE